jgi:uncharacterized protein YecT (DUF1311 family)
MVLVALWFAALAATPSEYQEHNCDNPMSQMDMNFCAHLDFEAADAELNTLWKQIVADAREADSEVDRGTDTRPTSEAVLRDAQRAWIQFRDAQCTFEGYEARGGSMEPMLAEGCRARLTRERTAQLRAPQEETH